MGVSGMPFTWKWSVLATMAPERPFWIPASTRFSPRLAGRVVPNRERMLSQNWLKFHLPTATLP
jgi:hypothetical protein